VQQFNARAKGGSFLKETAVNTCFAAATKEAPAKQQCFRAGYEKTIARRPITRQ